MYSLVTNMILPSLLLFFTIINKCTCLQNPVLVIDSGGVLDNLNDFSNPLKLTSQQQFVDFLQEIAKRQVGIVIFVEKELSVEDISTKTRDGTPFNNMYEALLQKKIKYLPAVDQPFLVLSNIFIPQPEGVFNNLSICTLHSTFDRLNDNLTVKHFYFHLGEAKANETREELLMQHDFILKEMLYYLRVTQKKDFIGLYTGRKNTYSKVKNWKHIRLIEFEPELDGTEDEVFVSSNDMLFHLQGINYKSAVRSSQTEIPYVAEDEWIDERKYSTKMTFSDFEIRFDFNFDEAFWRIETVHLLEGHEVVGSLRMGVGAPTGYSFYCNCEPIVLENSRDGSYVTINKYHILPYDSAMESHHLKNPLRMMPRIATVHDPDIYLFLRALNDSPSVHCGRYFPATIISVLFVVSLLIFICVCGIVALMSLNTNDRYDDPHGKQLQMHVEI